MVQDNLDTLLCASILKVDHQHTGESQYLCGKYRSSLPLPDEYETDPDFTAYTDKYTYHCTTIPGEAPWLAPAEDEILPYATGRHSPPPTPSNMATSSTASPTKRKRSRDVDDDDDDQSQDDDLDPLCPTPSMGGGSGMDVAPGDASMSLTPGPGNGGDERKKRVKGLEKGGASSTTPMLGEGEEAIMLTARGASLDELADAITNLPGTGEETSAFGAILHFYDQDPGLKLNVLLDVVGILELTPGDTAFLNADDAAEIDFYEEHVAHHPPSSLVPHIHVLTFSKLIHPIPFLAQPTPGPRTSAPSSSPNVFARKAKSLPRYSHRLPVAEINAAIPDWEVAREAALAHLASYVGGDLLAAEYLLLLLMSRMSTEPEVSAPLSSFHVNLSNVSTANAGDLYVGIRQIVPLAIGIPLSIGALNARPFLPHKDYMTNRLVAGVLQIAPATLIMVDETAMESGEMTQVGVSNLFAVAGIMDSGRVEYDFGASSNLAYDNVAITMDNPVLVLSEGVSMFASTRKQAFGELPRLVHVPIVPDEAHNAASPLQDDPSLANVLRAFFEAARWAEYTLADEHSPAIAEEYTELRTHPEVNMDPQRLSLWLSLARWHTISHGSSEFSMESFQAIKAMELARLSRTPVAAPAPAPST